MLGYKALNDKNCDKQLILRTESTVLSVKNIVSDGTVSPISLDKIKL